MTLVDLAVLAVLAISALLGLSRGFVRELLGLAAWLLAGYAAFAYGPALQPWAERTIGTPDLADPVAYVAVFLGVLLALSLLANLIGRAVRLSALGSLDRTLGLLFGLTRGAAVLIAGYILGGMLLPPENWPPAFQRARTLPLLYQGAAWAITYLPPKFRPRVEPPPEGPPTTAADLMHVQATGTALGPRPDHN